MYFSKYEACGNNFILIDNPHYKKYLNKRFIERFCDSNHGASADGLIYYDIKRNKMHIYNKDGSEASMCVNGFRALALHIYLNFDKNRKLKINVGNTRYQSYICDDGIITNFKKPRDSFTKHEIFFKDNSYILYEMNYLTKNLVLIDVEPNLDLTLFIRNFFPNHNINFVKVLNRQEIKVKTHENGVGFTESCGSGSLNSYYILNSLNLIEDRISVLYLKDKAVIYKKNNDYLYIKGPALLVYKGIYGGNYEKGTLYGVSNTFK